MKNAVQGALFVTVMLVMVGRSCAQPLESQTGPAASGLKRLSPTDEVWVDAQRKQVIVGGEVTCREGPLEMFACPKGTKEYESVVAVNSKAYLVHTGLLAIGANPGSPVVFAPEYKPATGDVIDVFVTWTNEEGKAQKVRAQEWVHDVAAGQPMTHDWVFAGSGFWTDEQSGERYYLAEGGELICVSNFASATLDLPVPSTQTNSELLFAANTERIPPLGTKVRVILVPRPK
jgi:hypothetical protein